MVTELTFSWVRFSFDTATAILSYKVIAAAVVALVVGIAAPPYVARAWWGEGPHVVWALAGAVIILAVAALGIWWWANSARAV